MSPDNRLITCLCYGSPESDRVTINIWKEDLYNHRLPQIKAVYGYLGHTTQRPPLGTGTYRLSSRSNNFV